MTVLVLITLGRKEADKLPSYYAEWPCKGNPSSQLETLHGASRLHCHSMDHWLQSASEAVTGSITSGLSRGSQGTEGTLPWVYSALASDSTVPSLQIMSVIFCFSDVPCLVGWTAESWGLHNCNTPVHCAGQQLVSWGTDARRDYHRWRGRY